MSLEELKAVTTCTACQQVGHWHDDPECPKRLVENKKEMNRRIGNGKKVNGHGLMKSGKLGPPSAMEILRPAMLILHPGL